MKTIQVAKMMLNGNDGNNTQDSIMKGNIRDYLDLISYTLMTDFTSVIKDEQSLKYILEVKQNWLMKQLQEVLSQKHEFGAEHF